MSPENNKTDSKELGEVQAVLDLAEQVAKEVERLSGFGTLIQPATAIMLGAIFMGSFSLISRWLGVSAEVRLAADVVGAAFSVVAVTVIMRVSPSGRVRRKLEHEKIVLNDLVLMASDLVAKLTNTTVIERAVVQMRLRRLELAADIETRRNTKV